MKNPNGYIIYEGASLLDGKPIVAIALTGKSTNTKTGAMIQTFIIRSDIDPLTANKTGADFSICGNCTHRGESHTDTDRKTAKNRSCYVTLFHAPLTVYKQYKAGKYPHIDNVPFLDRSDLGADRMVRIGAYGDGSAIPAAIWQSLISKAKGFTGYSHQADLPQADFNPALYMQSVESEFEAFQSWAQGKRTFRVIERVADLVAGKEILCPASEEAGKRTTCQDCGLCAGTSSKSPKSIAIVAHGAGKGAFKAA